MDKARVGLMDEDCPKRPCNGDGGGKITLGGGEGIGGSSSLEEEKCKEDKDLGPDAGTVGETVDTKGVKGGDYDKDGSPAVVERERKVDEELISVRLGCVILLDDVIDVCDRGADEESKDKGNDVMVRRPQVDVDGVEDTKEREAP